MFKKNDNQLKGWHHKVIIQLQIGMEIVLFSKFKQFMSIALIKISLSNTVFAGLQLNEFINTMKILVIYIYIYIYIYI